MRNNTIKLLEWDSQFFGYPVARITIDNEYTDKLDDLFLQIKTHKFRLVYFIVPPEEIGLNIRIKRMGSTLVDQKTVFAKQTKEHKNILNIITEFTSDVVNNELYKLVLQAGQYSRFRIDANFTNREFERLYFEWLNQSIQKRNDFKILVSKKQTNIAGITTIGVQEQFAEIGLVAVDRNCRRQGIGKDLILSADTFAYARGINEIKVTTQLKNSEACRLYEKCNFHIEKITNIYHYWRK